MEEEREGVGCFICFLFTSQYDYFVFVCILGKLLLKNRALAALSPNRDIQKEKVGSMACAIQCLC